MWWLSLLVVIPLWYWMAWYWIRWLDRHGWMANSIDVAMCWLLSPVPVVTILLLAISAECVDFKWLVNLGDRISGKQ